MNLVLELMAIIAAAFIQLGDGCVCMPTHPQNAFCKSDFAMKVEVTSRRKYKYMNNYKMYEDMGIPAPRLAFYEVNIHKIFKGQQKLQSLIKVASNLMTTTVHTFESQGACGASLVKNERYLLTGRIVDGKIHISNCDWKPEWRHLTRQMREGIHGAYDCSCSVATCIDGYCDKKDNSCQWNVSWDKPVDECTPKFRSCRKFNQHCEWKSSLEYKVCSGEAIP